MNDHCPHGVHLSNVCYACLSDDELSRRVAEAEGWEHHHDSDYYPFGEWQHSSGIKLTEVPPYDTDWAWCGPLVEKYQLCVRWLYSEKEWEAIKVLEDPVIHSLRKYADTPQRAICLAVLALKEGRDD